MAPGAQELGNDHSKHEDDRVASRSRRVGPWGNRKDIPCAVAAETTTAHSWRSDAVGGPLETCGRVEQARELVVNTCMVEVRGIAVRSALVPQLSRMGERAGSWVTCPVCPWL